MVALTGVSHANAHGACRLPFIHKETDQLHPRTSELIEKAAQIIEKGGIEAWFDADISDFWVMRAVSITK